MGIKNCFGKTLSAVKMSNPIILSNELNSEKLQNPLSKYNNMLNFKLDNFTSKKTPLVKLFCRYYHYHLHAYDWAV